MELIDFLLVVIAVLYIIRLIARIVLPRLFQSLVNKAQQQQQNHQQNYTRNTNTADKIKVDYIPQTPKGKIPDSEGDFIDYEEIK
jgi:hypothetical protein